MATTQADQITRLISEYGIESSEAPFRESDNLVLNSIWADAAALHNPSFTSFSQIPERELPLVRLLCGYEITRIRANRLSSSPSLSGGSGYGSDRDTPFNKCLALMTTLQNRYEVLCASYGVSAAVITGNQSRIVSVSDLRTRSQRTGLLIPNSADAPPQLTITIVALNHPSDVVFGWTKAPFDNFREFVIALLQKNRADNSTVSVRQKYNMNSATGVPQIHDNAAVRTIQNKDQEQVMITGLDTEQYDYSLLVAVHSLSDSWSYSNDISITGAVTPPVAGQISFGSTTLFFDSTTVTFAN